MSFVSYIGGFFHVLAVAGMLVAPLARPATAMPTSTPAAVGADLDAGATAAAGMPDDMPCCPDKAPSSDCDKACPLMALCSVTNSQNLPPTSALVVAFGLASIVIPANDAPLHSLALGPPRKPPKT